MRTLAFPALLLGLGVAACDAGRASAGGADDGSATASSSSGLDSTEPSAPTNPTPDPETTSTTTLDPESSTSTSGPDPSEESSTTVSSTGTPADCGDGVAEGIEECDGDDLADQYCADYGFIDGELSCNDICQLEFDACANFSCGDGTIDRDEICDGRNLDGQSCPTLGFDNGALACDRDCFGFDTASCGTCGDGTVDLAETCEAGELSGQTCVTQGFGGGTLGCATDCLDYDTAGCVIDCCFSGVADDPGCQDVDVESCVCETVGDSYCCDDDWDTTCVDEAIELCGAVCGACGNGLIEPGEDCDGGNLGGASCGSLGFDGGTLSCAGNCLNFDATNCIAVPSWSGEVHPIFTASCGCHGSGFPPWSGNPSAAVAYDLIVDVTNGGGQPYIDSGSADGSLIMQRIESAGAPMPPAPALPLTAAQQQLIRDWIDAGAPEN